MMTREDRRAELYKGTRCLEISSFEIFDSYRIAATVTSFYELDNLLL
jgi:hypothetical protein